MRNSPLTRALMLLIGILHNNYTKNVNKLKELLSSKAEVAENVKAVYKTESDVLGGKHPRVNTQARNYLKVNYFSISLVGSPIWEVKEISKNKLELRRLISSKALAEHLKKKYLRLPLSLELQGSRTKKTTTL